MGASNVIESGGNKGMNRNLLVIIFTLMVLKNFGGNTVRVSLY